MKTRSTRTALSLVALSLVAGCGIENALVGGRCRDGMVLDGDTCVAVTETPPTTATTPGTPPTDAAPVTPPSDAGNPTPATDGATSYDPEPPLLLADAGDAAPDLMCTPPLVACHGTCISVDSDPANCGACGKQCPSNICVAGECQGATPGDVVLIGHDYTNASAGSAQTKVLVNAFSIPTTDPVRVLSFEDGAPVAAVSQMKALAEGGLNRKIAFTRASSSSALASTTLFRDYDVVIINDASAVDPAVTGAQWQAPLNTFAMKGGVVLAIDVGDSAMPDLLANAGLLSVGGHTVLPVGSHLVVNTASDVIGTGVLSPYAAFGAPVSFQGVMAPTADLSWVVRVKQSDGTSGDPVVVHRTVR